jgi:general secretion pathway protein D
VPEAEKKVEQGPTAPLTDQRPRRVDVGKDVVVAVDKGSNRLIAMGQPRMLDQLGRLIAELDVKHTQVLVEAIAVSLTEGQTRSLGVELRRVGTSGDAMFQLGSLFGLGSPDPNSGTLLPVTGTGFAGVVLDPGDFSAVVRALATVNDGRTVTIPKVLVNNNETANLGSVVQSPYASTNASDTVATTSFGGTLDAGTQITVTPPIAEGDLLILNYQVSLSSFVGEASDPALPPPRQENSLSSIATVPDGFAVVVGGLELDTESDTVSKVPLLGDIPGLGVLFRNTSKTRSKSRFFVFLRCSVMRGTTFEELRYMSDADLAAAGIDDGLPELEPRIIR